MKADKVTVFELFEKQRRYLVPIFQRGYVWKLEDQWKPLWEDIVDQTSRVREQGAAPQRQDRKHFLGAIVLNQVPTMIKQISASEIIDGQQRMMTLQIILAAFRDVMAASNNQYINKSLETLTANVGAFHNPDETFKVWPTNAYQVEFRSLMQAKSCQGLLREYPYRIRYNKITPQLPELVAAYVYFYGVLRSYLHEGQPPDFQNIVDALHAATADSGGDGQSDGIDNELAEHLFEAISRQVQLVEIALEAEDDPQVIFETLNARGVPLEPSDLIRNFIFLFAGRNGEDVSALYDMWWKDFDESVGKTGKFWKEKVTSGRLKRSRLDLFLFHYMKYLTGQDVKITHVYQEFRSWWEENGATRKTTDELEAIRRSSRVFRDLTSPSDGSRFSLFAERLNVLDTTTVYPLVLWLSDHNRQIPEEDFLKILQDIESYLVRRTVCGLTTKNYNRTFLSLMNKLGREDIPVWTLLRQELSQLQGDSDAWPSDEEFLRQLVYRPLYDVLGPSRTKMILRAIELEMLTSKSEGIPVPDSLTVEHVMPQLQRLEEWPYPEVSSGHIPPLTQRWMTIQTLGNLTLLTQSLNSAISNGPFRDKRPEIARQSQLRLNAYFQQFSDDFQWNEIAILKRGQELAKGALKIWPGPEPAPV